MDRSGSKISNWINRLLNDPVDTEELDRCDELVIIDESFAEFDMDGAI